MAKAKYTETTEQKSLKALKKQQKEQRGVSRFGDVKGPEDSPLDEGVYQGTDPDYQTRLYVELDGSSKTPDEDKDSKQAKTSTKESKGGGTPTPPAPPSGDGK